ncbi:MAG TPA: YlxR family protein [Microlunatus sp.]|nr:YlxR family protein [Microlunatus sp.]
MSEPVRTCIGCRVRAAKRDLLRVVWTGTAVGADDLQRAPGRGAYLHRDPRCLEQAIRRRAFGRALRREGIGPEQLADLRLLLDPPPPDTRSDTPPGPTA